MAKLSKAKPAKLSQRDRFIATARALGADEDEATFKAKLGKIAKAKAAPKRQVKERD